MCSSDSSREISVELSIGDEGQEEMIPEALTYIKIEQ
jgi:hypothetical protein